MVTKYKNWEFPRFKQKQTNIFGHSHVFFTIVTETMIFFFFFFLNSQWKKIV